MMRTCTHVVYAYTNVCAITHDVYLRYENKNMCGCSMYADRQTDTHSLTHTDIDHSREREIDIQRYMHITMTCGAIRQHTEEHMHAYMCNV